MKTISYIPSLRGAFFATKQSMWIASSQKTLLAMTVKLRCGIFERFSKIGLMFNEYAMLKIRTKNMRYHEEWSYGY